MSWEDELERHLQKNAQALEELAIQIDTQNRQAEELLKELQVSHQQLSAFIEKKEHFTEENWKTLHEERKALDEKLLRELANVRNPVKAKKAQAERNVQPHWLFVR